jgi:biotin carboxyl carrier protein
MAYSVTVDGKEYSVFLNRQKNIFKGTLNGKDIIIELAHEADGMLFLIIDNTPYSVVIGTDNTVVVNDESYTTSIIDEQLQKLIKASPEKYRKKETVIKSPMPGLIIEIMVEEGTPVKDGQGLLVVEAMKMQNEMSAPCEGVVKEIHVKQGQTVNSGDTLMVIE